MSILQGLLPRVGERVSDRFELVEEIGRGGFGVFFKAVQVGLDAEVALKILLPHVLDNEDIVGRFQREVAVAKSLKHPNSIRILDVNTTDKGIPYYVMEMVHGDPLDLVLRTERKLSPARTQRILTQVLKALGEAHAKGVVHRDLKPGNLMVCDIHGEKDYVKVLDFGIAKALTADGPLQQTSTGMVLGTPAYMSPEQATGARDLDGRSDLYALGLIMAECIAGRPVVSGETPYVIVAIHAMPNPLTFPMEVQQSPLWPIIYRATLKERDHRFRTAEEMLEALSSISGLSSEVSATGVSNEVYAPPPSLPGMTPAPQHYSGQMAPHQPQPGVFGSQPVQPQQVHSAPTMAREAHAMSDEPSQGGGGKAILILVLLFLVGGGAGAFLLLGGGDDEESESTTPVVENVEEPTEEPLPVEEVAVTEPNQELPVVEAPTQDPNLTTAMAISTDRVASSVPSVRAIAFGGTDRVTVKLGDTVLGVTPFSAQLPHVERELELSFEREGYVSSSEAVSLLSPSVDIDLRRRRERRSGDRPRTEPVEEEPTGFGQTGNSGSNSPFGQTNIHD